MLNGKQKSYLRGLANSLSSLFQVGKDGVSENVIASVNNALTAHELIKLNVLKTCPETLENIAVKISRSSRSEVVQIIGKTIILYRRNPKEPKILL